MSGEEPEMSALSFLGLVPPVLQGLDTEGLPGFFLPGGSPEHQDCPQGEQVSAPYLPNPCSEIREKGRKWALGSRACGPPENEK